MDFTGKPMKAMMYVSPAGLGISDALEAWLNKAVRFALTLPAK